MAARELTDDVPPEEKRRRRSKAEDIEETIAREINAGILNKTVEVLVEGKKKGKFQGRTRQDKLVFFPSNADLRGRLVRVKIDKTSPWALQGNPEQ